MTREVKDLEIARQDLAETMEALKGAMGVIGEAHVALMENKPTKAKSLLMLALAANACEIEWSEVTRA